jgi:uncharacterized protein DUF2630
MDDKSIMSHINELVEEERSLREAEAAGTIDDPGRERMQSLEVELDRTWDLLRQRRARRDFGENPDEAQERSPEVVENYLQ